MSSSPHNRNNPDSADRVGSAIGLAVLLSLSAWMCRGPAFGPRIGETKIHPETVLHLAFAPSPPWHEPPPSTEMDSSRAPEEIEEKPEEILVERMPAELEGEAGPEDALRTEWMARLRRRIEENKFYPGAARYARETGTVTLDVEIGANARIGRVTVIGNTGSPLLAEGARAIVRRVAATPLDTNRLPSAIRVEVPITYRIRSR